MCVCVTAPVALTDVLFVVVVVAFPFLTLVVTVWLCAPVLDAAQEDALLSALAVKQVGADPTWTVLGIWDNDEAVPVGAILGTHGVHGERAWRELANDPDFFGFDTSSFYEQGVWAETVTAPDGDTAQDLAVELMMRGSEG